MKPFLLSVLILFTCGLASAQPEQVTIKLTYAVTDTRDCDFLKVRLDSSSGVLLTNFKKGFFETLIPKGKTVELTLKKDPFHKKDDFYILLTGFQTNGQSNCQTPGYQASASGKLDAAYKINFFNP